MGALRACPHRNFAHDNSPCVRNENFEDYEYSSGTLYMTYQVSGYSLVPGIPYVTLTTWRYLHPAIGQINWV